MYLFHVTIARHSGCQTLSKSKICWPLQCRTDMR